MDGTPKNIVPPLVSWRTTFSGVKGMRTAEPPLSKVPCKPIPRPCRWKSGSAWTSTSRDVQRHTSSAPLGRPVVPEV